MMHTTTVALPPREVLERAKAFFAERVPHVAAFVEKEGPQFVALRGQAVPGPLALPGALRLRHPARPPAPAQAVGRAVPAAADGGGGAAEARGATLAPLPYRASKQPQ